MKTIITMIIAIVMFGFSTAAQASEFEFQMITKEQVAKNILETIPMVQQSKIDNCYNAVKNGGLYTISSSRVSVFCTKGEMTRMFAQ